MSQSSRLNLVCVDDSEFSINGLNWYIKNHHRENDVIGLVHVHEMPSVMTAGFIGGGPPAVNLYTQEIDKSYEKVKALQKKYEDKCDEKGLKHQFFLVDIDKKPGHAICKFADEKNVSSIVMGQRGLGTISRALLGSTSDYVLHHAHVPVLVVPPSKK